VLASLVLSLLLATNETTTSRAALEIKARQFFGNFVAGRFEAATRDFNDSIRANVTPAVLADLKKKIEAEVGGFKSITEVHPRREGSFEAIELIVSYEKAPVSVRVVFDRNYRIGSLAATPIRPQPVDPKLEAAARELLANFAARRFDRVIARFDAAMRAQLPAAKLTALHDDVERVFGTFRSVTAVRQETAQAYQVIDLTASYERSPVTFRVVFDKAGSVSGLYISPLVPKS
jgi:hypothetical protein